MGVIMRVRYLLAAAIILPVFFLFGLDTYLERFEQHSKYLSQLRDTLMMSLGDKDNKISKAEAIKAGMPEREFRILDKDNSGYITQQECDVSNWITW
jgi:hypothetical protein